MGLFDKIKNMVTEEDEDYDYDTEIAEEQEEDYFGTAKSTKSDNARRTNTAGPVGAGIQVVLVKPERFEEAPAIGDHLCQKKTVVLNLEAASREVAKRLIDFLSGVAYTNDGQIKRVANNTYIITPYNVDLKGDLIDELENNGLYF